MALVPRWGFSEDVVLAWGRRVATAAVCALVLSACGSGAPTAKPEPTATPSPTVTPSPAVTPSATATATPSATSSPTPTTPRTSPPRPTTTPASPGPTAAGRPATPIWRGATTRKEVALTFDAGSDVGHTTQILDLLQQHGIHATFGITGRWARAYPAIARRIASAGHLVVNHSDTHPSFTGSSTGAAPLTRAQRLHELSAAEASIRATTGRAALPWFRPPYGDRDAGVDADVGSAGYRYELMWSVDTLGWKGVAPSEVTRRVLAAATPGEIVLMHVGTGSTDWQALAAVIRELSARGYRFVRADGFS